jgi:hypothetical protein
VGRRRVSAVSDRERESDTRSLRDWLAPLVSALALISLLMYGLVRVFYANFYDDFGITPEDVGASSSVVLPQTAIGVIAFLLGALLINLILVVPIFLVAFAVSQRSGKHWTWKGVLKVVLGGGLVLALYLLVVNMDDRTEAAADCALAGGNVRGGESIRFSPAPMLNFRAQRVKLTWLANPKRRPALGRKIMLLGESSGTTFVYDVDARRTTRFPSSAAALALLETPDRLCPNY